MAQALLAVRGLGGRLDEGVGLEASCALSLRSVCWSAQALATGCSGSGAPTHALQQLVGENYHEEISSESHDACLRDSLTGTVW